MKPVFQILLCLSLLAFGCEEHVDVAPTPPPTEDQAPAVVTEAPQPKPQVPVESELYQYGKFREMPYRILFPRNYDSTKQYPLVIMLHGIGERGFDNENQLSLGSTLFQADSIRDKYPAFIVYPQCPMDYYWFNDPVTKTLKGLIDTLMATYVVDESRLLMAGFSMGAYGTFAMVANYPGLFKSAVAVSGDGNPNKAPAMSKTHWRIFAGKKDTVVPSTRTEKMVKALANSGASVSFTLYPEADHQTSWTNASSEPDFLYWLFSE